MKIVVTSGGTAGHIYPALAVAQALRAAGHELFFAGSTHGQEVALVAQEGISYKGFESKGFNRSKPASLPAFVWHTQRSTTLAKKWLGEVKPDAVVGFGGFASVPVCRAALKKGLPVLIHEQNSAAGWANRFLARLRVGAIALTYEQARKQLTFRPETLVELTGNPVRSSLLECAEPEARALARTSFRSACNIPANACVLLVFGGSQGARSINEAVVTQASSILAQPNTHVVHLTGPKQFDAVCSQLAQTLNEQQQKRWHAIDYCTQMGEAFAASDVVLARAGAGSLAEIAVFGIPALLVPYPYATDDHQTANARSLVEAGAARCVIDADLSSPVFAETLIELLENETLRTSMTQAASSSDAAGATNRIIELLYKIAK
ncbi:MAG: undecaprenyldiphospho-muramoylpentapeptide beta-N-acetylglucosaminyltransferase [Coriobacteriia bacterium]|nr:undecaprenyldiphospho-muramoylpentapeptide beta-N-acetylglucosaminyltransferase [Coriobacteriia bacterium]